MNKAIEYFWIWFTANHMQLENPITLSTKNNKHYLYWLEWHLHFYVPGTDLILIYPTRKNKKLQMIITANGNKDLFDKVEQVIKAAPTIKGWEFISFIKSVKDIDDIKAGLDKPYVFKDINLKAIELKSMTCKFDDSKKINMIVYFKNFTVHCNNKNLLQLIFIIQDIIGEKVLYENINFVELAKMTSEESIEQIYLYDLQYYLDEINKQQTNIKD